MSNKDRLDHLRREMREEGLDGLIVANPANIWYLTGLEAEDAWLLVGPRRVYYVTDSRYTLAVGRQLKSKDIEVVEYKKDPYGHMGRLLRARKTKWMGFDEREFSVAQYKRLNRQVPAMVRLKGGSGMVERLRLRKDKQEIRLIRKALKIHARALAILRENLRPGQTEREVLDLLAAFMRQEKMGFSFPPIIASGRNSCFPHAKVTDRKIRANEPILVDFGVQVQGYKSDLTRMFFLGRMTALVQGVCAHVREAQRRAIAVAAPGVPVAEVDRAARQYLAEQDLAKWFGHALGHGVGLDIHEAPRLSQSSREVLQPGMVVTIEPGVYLPNRFGVRIEDMLLITDKGCEVLSDNIH